MKNKNRPKIIVHISRRHSFPSEEFYYKVNIKSLIKISTKHSHIINKNKHFRTHHLFHNKIKDMPMRSNINVLSC